MAFLDVYLVIYAIMWASKFVLNEQQLWLAALRVTVGIIILPHLLNGLVRVFSRNIFELPRRGW